MIFGHIPLDDAEGTILAHTVHAEGGKVAKGTRLTQGDIARLRAAGIESVMAARPESGDIMEDEAARRVAAALCGTGMEALPPINGRCNIRATAHGVLSIDAAAVNGLNNTGGDVLLATLSAYAVVEPGRIVATLKVIPYAVSENGYAAALEAASGAALQVHAFAPRRVGLVLTEVADMPPKLADKARTVIAARVETYGSAVVDVRTVAHAEEPLAESIADLARRVDVVLVMGAASTADVRDTVPAAMTRAGGTVDVFGIPVDPGNLLSAGRIGDIPVIGLPGCARSPKMNGVDLVLPRVFAGLDIGREALLSLGVGGLLHDVVERPQPRESHDETMPPEPNIAVAAVIMAAGASRRMGAENKLLKPVDGVAMVRRVVETALASQVSVVVVVTGHDADAVRAALDGLDVHFVHNLHYEEGLSTSVRAGIGRVADTCAGAVMMLGDMPGVTVADINALVAAFRERGGTCACVPVHQGRRGNPVVWPREFFPDMLDLAGDMGARELLSRFADRVAEIDVNDDGIFQDVDTPEDWEKI